jgi:hypothetical protein
MRVDKTLANTGKSLSTRVINDILFGKSTTGGRKPQGTARQTPQTGPLTILKQYINHTDGLKTTTQGTAEAGHERRIVADPAPAGDAPGASTLFCAHDTPRSAGEDLTGRNRATTPCIEPSRPPFPPPLHLGISCRRAQGRAAFLSAFRSVRILVPMRRAARWHSDCGRTSARQSPSSKKPTRPRSVSSLDSAAN